MSALTDFLESMPFDKWYKIKPEQLPEIKRWMTGREWQGGLTMNKGENEIYKNDVSKFYKNGTEKIHSIPSRIDQETGN